MTATLEEINRLRPAERLRLCARLGAQVRAFGPVEEDVERFGERLIARGVLPQLLDGSAIAIREQLMMLHQMGQWAQTGFNVFDLSAGLATNLVLTDPAPVVDELRLPYPCFYIKLPEGIVPMFANGQQYWADGIWVLRFRSAHERLGSGTPFIRWAVERKSLWLWKDRFPSTLDVADEGICERIWEHDPPYVPEDDISTDRALRVLKNLTSWLDVTNGGDAAPPQAPHLKRKPSKARRAELADDVWPRVWMFGQTVALDARLRQAAREFALNQSSAHALPGWKVSAAHMVRGHFKQQAHGPRFSLHHRIWLQPYWRAEDNLVAHAHSYVDRAEKGSHE